MRPDLTLCLTLLALAAAGCRPSPQPPASDSTVVVLPDSAAVSDTGVTDTLEWPANYVPDTTQMTDADIEMLTRAAAARPRLRAAPSASGMAFGMSGYKPTSKWCEARTTINATNMTISPGSLRAALDAAVRCGFRFQASFPRASMTTNGQWNGPFSLTKAKQLVDAFAAVLPPALAQSYFDTGAFLGFYTLDDMGCAHCWGGSVITQQTTAELLKYAQQKLGAVPLCLRVHPEWMLRNGATKATWLMPDGTNAVDCNISQFYVVFSSQKPYPTQQQWYARQATAQATLGVPAQMFTVAWGGCHKAGLGDGCPADEMKRLGMIANAQPKNCANLGWNWRDEFATEPHLSVVKALAADAATRPKRSCWREL